MSLDKSKRRLSGRKPSGEITHRTRSASVSSTKSKSIEQLYSSSSSISSDSEYLSNGEVLRIKMIIIGNSGVGKSSLFAAMKHKEKEVKKKKYPSLGLGKKKKKVLVVPDPIPAVGLKQYTNDTLFQVYSLSLLSTTDNEIKFNVWDFTGSESYRSIQSIFFSERTIFLLVWNLANSSSLSSLRVWISTVLSRVPKASIILVGTHLDMEKEKSFKTQIDSTKSTFASFNNVKAVIAISAETHKGIDELLKIIEEVTISQPNITKEKFPKSYFMIEHQLISQNPHADPIFVLGGIRKDC